MLVRVIHRDGDAFAQEPKYGANLRLMREHNFVQKSRRLEVANFLILKSDLEHIKQLNQQSTQLVMTDMKSVIKLGVAPKKAEGKQPAAGAEDVITDSQSVISSASAILDSISSIFSMRSVTQAPQQPLPSQP